MGQKLQVVCDWDDGAIEDERLATLLRKHKAKATFNLSANRLSRTSKPETHKTQVFLTRTAAMEVYSGFLIGNHVQQHRSLLKIDTKQVIFMIAEGRRQLQDIFNQEVQGFAYPLGLHDGRSEEAVAASGHVYGRTTGLAGLCWPQKNRFQATATTVSRGKHFWRAYEAAKACGVFWFRGHSWEFTSDEMWVDLENKLDTIRNDPEAEWKNITDLPWEEQGVR